MKNLLSFFNKHKNKVNKYQIAIVIFIVVTFFIGDNTFLDGVRYETKIKSLQKEVETLRSENEKKLEQLNALQGDKESLEQFAREQFLMTKANEDLFLIIE
jgi:cell division protein FtsB